MEVFRKAGLWVRGKGNSKKTLKWTFLWLPSRRGGDPGRLVMLIFIVLPIATMAAACLLLSPWQEKCDWLDWEHWRGGFQQATLNSQISREVVGVGTEGLPLKEEV